MTEQLLHRSDVGARLQQMGGKGMAQSVDGNRFGDACQRYRLLERATSPCICANNPATSPLVNTLGMRRFWAGRLMPLSQGNSMASTSR